MRNLLAAALVCSLAALARADTEPKAAGAAAASDAPSPAPRVKHATKGSTHAASKPKKASVAKKGAKPAPKAQGDAAAKPCEPVKPCPID